MTEAEWLSLTDPQDLLAHVEPIWSERKRRLFACTCGRRYCLIWPDTAATSDYYRRLKPATDVTARQFIEALEDQCDDCDVTGALVSLREALHALGPIGFQHDVGVTTDGDAASWVARFPKVPDDIKAQGRIDSGRLQRMAGDQRYLVDLFRCVVGNPFRPVAADPSWRTSTAVALAQQMYESRDFGPMPILADALQDAGCDHADILAHCRDPHAVHVRGCWVVDLVLGKS